MKRKLLLAFITVLALMLVMTVPASADNYKYDVTVDGGLYGEISGDTSSEFDLNAVWSPDDYEVTVTNPKYYFKGFHISGIEGVIVGAQPITEDTDFVATYGISGTQKKYTVNYVSDDGEIDDTREFYGNVGDDLVVAYWYYEGYRPDQDSQPITISENEADNVITFTYTAVVAPTPEEEEEGGEGGEGGGGGGGNANPPAGGGGGGNAAPPAGGDETTPGDQGGENGENINNEDTPTNDTPGDDQGGNGGDEQGSDDQSGENIDDEDNPSDVSPDGEQDGEGGLSAGAIAGIAAAIVAAALALFFGVFKRKKNEE